MIPMRDGKRLHTKIFTPRQGPRGRHDGEPLPIIFKRTPYGIEGVGEQLQRVLQGARGRGLHLRAPGHPREVRVRRRLRDAAARPPSPGLRRGRLDDPTVDRRRHRHLRHHRLADQERAQQQRPRRHARRVVRRLDDDHGRDRAASGAQGHLAAGVARRHVAGRRLPSQRRVPIELRLRVRRDDGERQGRAAVLVRPLRHVRLVSEPRPARERQREVPARQDPDVERLRRASRLRRVLEAPDDDSAPDQREGADAERRGLVGPGGFLRTGRDLRRAREARHAGHQLSRRRAVAPRRLERRHRRFARRDSVRQQHRRVLPREDPGAVLRVLPERQGHARLSAGDHVRGRRERVAAMGSVAADETAPRRERCTSAPNETLARSSDRERIRRAGRDGSPGFDEYVSDPGASGAVSPAADPADVLPRRLEVVDVAGRGSALRRRSRRRAQLGNGAARSAT